MDSQDTRQEMNLSLHSQGRMEDMWLLEIMPNGGSLGMEILVIANISSLMENVLLVDGWKHNLLKISQLCDKGFKVSFETSHCIIKDI